MPRYLDPDSENQRRLSHVADGAREAETGQGGIPLTAATLTY